MTVTCELNIPYAVLDPTAETNKQEENEQDVLGKLKYYDIDA
jgi:hypothetical protein